MNTVIIKGYEINRRLVNQVDLATECKYSQSYISQLLNPNNKRKNDKAITKMLNALIKQKSGIIKRHEVTA